MIQLTFHTFLQFFHRSKAFFWLYLALHTCSVTTDIIAPNVAPHLKISTWWRCPSELCGVVGHRCHLKSSWRRQTSFFFLSQIVFFYCWFRVDNWAEFAAADTSLRGSFSAIQLEFLVPIQGRGWPIDVFPSSVQSKCPYAVPFVVSSDVLSETDRGNQGLGNSNPHKMTLEMFCPLEGKPAIRWANLANDESPSRVCPLRRWRNCNQKWVCSFQKLRSTRLCRKEVNNYFLPLIRHVT